jgi:hypothetical protein
MNAPRLPAAVTRATPIFVYSLFLFIVVIGYLRAAATMSLHVPLDPNEGWNAYHAAAAMTGRALYPGAKTYFVNNYPPLSFYIVGALGRFVGDHIVAGRIVSLSAFLFTAMGILAAARRMGCGVADARIGGLFFAASLLFGSDYVGMNDPQLLGHAIQIGALLLILRGWDLGAAFLFVMGIFVKHNLVALPLAVALWFVIEDRARAWRFAAASAGFTLVGFGLFRLAFGSGLFSHLASARTFSSALLVANVQSWLIWSAVPLVIVGLLFAYHRRDRFVVFCALYTVIAVALGVAFSGGAGVDVNVFFDADIALSLGIALALSRSAERGLWQPAVLAAALLLPLALGLNQALSGGDWRDPDYWIRPKRDEAAVANVDIAFLREHPGRALCESLSLCYWAGKDAEVDTFNVGQAFATGARSDVDLVRQIDARAFAVLEFDTLEPFALGPHVKAAVLKNYEIAHSGDDGVFLVPR